MKYSLCYWAYDKKILCYFSEYEDAVQAEATLKSRYPDSKIWIENISLNLMHSHGEFMRTFNGKIPDYEMNKIEL